MYNIEIIVWSLIDISIRQIYAKNFHNIKFRGNYMIVYSERTKMFKTYVWYRIMSQEPDIRKAHATFSKRRKSS